jgi:hypothetical protein
MPLPMRGRRIRDPRCAKRFYAPVEPKVRFRFRAIANILTDI